MAGGSDIHRPVMLAEAVEALAIRPGGFYMDVTYGRGGHAAAILEHLGPDGRLLVLDRDPEAVAAARARFGDDPRVTVRQAAFSTLGRLAGEVGWTGRVAGILMDLGVSSAQLEDPRRGFSFRRDGPLDMRMDPAMGQSAADWLAAAPEREIARVLREYGEERYAARIARAIVAARRERPILTTGRLQAVVARAHPAWEKGKDPATRTFQALRIHVNRELDELRDALDQVTDVLAPGGRLVVISFHSLEDRMVKRFIRSQARGDILPRELPVTDVTRRPRLRAVGRARHPSPGEVAINPRARSAVLRVAERLP